ncbi:MAG: hypothetical protein IPL79_20095 [Myxococcales bacterium]|nr:hypothetical protein [Myxococcales bacterium]
MISSEDIRSLPSLTKDLVSDQTETNIFKKTNVSAQGFDATKGFGQNTNNTSTHVLVGMGGFNNQKMTATLRFGNFTTQANSDIEVYCRIQGLDATDTCYVARMDNDVARISKMIAGSYTNITSTAMACAVDQDIIISLQVIGSALTATFENITANPGVVITLTGTDTTITSGGLMGFGSLSSSVWCKNFTAEEV